MKRTDLAKREAEKLKNAMGAKNAAFDRSGTAPDRRQQRERDRALGLVPFAVKLNGDLVKQLQALAAEREVGMDALVADLLKKGLDTPAAPALKPPAS